MSWAELLLVALAGGGAGLLNAMVGSGTLVTFPTLLALGVPPVLANVSNSIGLAPGNLSSALAGRRDLCGQQGRVLRYGFASLIGSVAGALLLLWLPPAAFRAIVPVLIGLGVVLVVLGPALSRRLGNHDRRGVPPGAGAEPPWTWPAIVLTGAYGGYFGAAQGVLVIAVLGLALAESLPRVNALKNVLAMIANTVAGVLFVIIAQVDWWLVLAIGTGSVLGAQVGVRIGRRLPPAVYRTVVVVVGLAAIIDLVTG